MSELIIRVADEGITVSYSGEVPEGLEPLLREWEAKAAATITANLGYRLQGVREAFLAGADKLMEVAP